MGAFRNAVRILFKRPSVIMFFGMVTLVFAVVNYFNPIYTIVFGLGSTGEVNVFESLVSFMRLIMGFLSDPAAILGGLLLILCILLILSVILGFFLSGYLNIMNNALGKKAGSRGEFAAGVRKHFSRIASVTFRVLLAGMVLLIYLMVVSVPAAIITRAASLAKPQLMISAVFVDILTLIILFFSVMFFRIYALFLYPSAMSLRKKAFLTGKRIADAHFWSIVKGLLAFDIVYIAVQLLLVYARSIFGQGGVGSQGSPLGILTLEWAFNTMFFSVFAAYILSLFKQLAGNSTKTDEPV